MLQQQVMKIVRPLSGNLIYAVQKMYTPEGVYLSALKDLQTMKRDLIDLVEVCSGGSGPSLPGTRSPTRSVGKAG